MVAANGATTVASRPADTYRGGVPMATSPSGGPRRRRWGVTLAGAGAVVVGGALGANLWLAAGDRVEVVALAADVGAYEPIERSDLATVRVAETPGVDVVSAEDVEDLVGRTARADLPAHSLLVDADLFPEDAALVDDGEAVVGAELVPGAVPVELARGRDVMLVIRPPATSTGKESPQVSSVEAWVLKVDDVDPGAGQSGRVVVSVVVPRRDASQVAAAAADERLSIVALEE